MIVEAQTARSSLNSLLVLDGNIVARDVVERLAYIVREGFGSANTPLVAQNMLLCRLDTLVQSILLASSCRG